VADPCERRRGGELAYSLDQEEPILQSRARQCSAAPSAAEEYEHAVPGAGSPDRPLQLALLEQVTRNAIRSELAALPPSAALPMYRGAIGGDGREPAEVVKRAVLVQEIERRGDTWLYDAKSERAADEHAAARELARLIAATRAARVPGALRAALDRVRSARQFVDRLRTIHKLRHVPQAELFGEDNTVSDKYKDHPVIASAMKRKTER
jgi:hypothetical protein